MREFVREAFSYSGLDWREYVETDPIYFRPTEVDYLLADPTKARGKLGWEPKVTFKELVSLMVDADLQALEEVRHCRDVVRNILAMGNVMAVGK